RSLARSVRRQVLPGSGHARALINVALKRGATQSSTLDDTGIYRVKRGTDGRSRGTKCFATKSEFEPRWMVRLRTNWPIFMIRIHGCAGRESMPAIPLTVSISAHRRKWDVVYSGEHVFHNGESPVPLEIPLLSRKGGRFVRVTRQGIGVLSLCQIEVIVEHQALDLRATCRRYGFKFPRMAGK
ncbi:MAG: hypothetical protein ACREEP_17200, partial [Dongiaceae bacterium]